MMKIDKKKLIAGILTLVIAACSYVVTEYLREEPTAVTGGGLTVQYIDVGQADCALLECDGQFMLVDGGNRDDSQLLVSFLEQQGVKELAAVVCSHAHEDHVGGLPAVLAVYPTKAVYAPTKTYSSSIFDKFVYYTDQQGLDITIPSPGDQFALGQAVVTVLGPVKSYADTNDTSIVLRVTYGETNFLFTGDMETEAENDMLDHWEGKVDWKTDVLKVGHHCSNTSTGYRFLNEVNPAYGVISVGKGNDYGHPHKEPMSRLRQAGVTILRTDELGTIQAVSDGKEVTFTWQKQSAVPENVEAAPQVFIGNKNSKVFHAQDCKNLPSEKNAVRFSAYREAIDAGFTPCGSCLG